MTTQELEEELEADDGKKVTLTIATLEGDYTHGFGEHQKLSKVVEQTIKHLKLQGEGPWILEKNGVELDQELTVKQAGLKDNDLLTLNPHEGGGGSRRL